MISGLIALCRLVFIAWVIVYFAGEFASYHALLQWLASYDSPTFRGLAIVSVLIAGTYDLFLAKHFAKS